MDRARYTHRIVGRKPQKWAVATYLFMVSDDAPLVGHHSFQIHLCALTKSFGYRSFQAITCRRLIHLISIAGLRFRSHSDAANSTQVRKIKQCPSVRAPLIGLNDTWEASELFTKIV